jgi:glycosyltransferase involved in cell wall biosynthesis
LFTCENNPPGAEHVLTHSGYVEPNRGPEQILQALAIIKRQTPVKLVVVGRVREEYRDEFLRRISELGLEEDVELLGHVPFEQMGAALNRGTIGLCTLQRTPNCMHTLSNKQFEYMATGQAVIGPINCDTAHLIRETDCGLTVDTTDAQAIAEAITLLISDPALRERYARNGRAAIEGEYGWHRMEERLWQVYERLEQPAS